MEINNQLPLVTLEQARRLKKAGFDWPTDYGVNTHNGDRIMSNMSPTNYNRGYDIHIASSPTVALALKWMRDLKGMMYCISVDAFNNEQYWVDYFEYNVWAHFDSKGNSFDSYESAESALLDELLTLIEK